MGKNRKTGQTPNDDGAPSKEPSKEFLINLAKKIAKWESFGQNNPTHEMTEEELEYIKEHEEILEYVDRFGRPINSLYRVERAYHFTPDGSSSIDDILKNLHKGDMLSSIDNDKSNYRSFSDDAKANYTYLSANCPWSNAVIIRTHGNISYFDPRKLADVYSSEKEVWVSKNKLKVDNLTRLQGKNISEELQRELGINSGYDVAPEDVLIIDVSPVGDNSYSKREEMWEQVKRKYPRAFK